MAIIAKNFLREKMKKQFMAFTLFFASTLFASNENSINVMENRSDIKKNTISYSQMSTAQLQEEVERRSINGDLSFDMGLELIRRWTNS